MPADGYGKSGQGMGSTQDDAAGERNPPTFAEGGERLMYGNGAKGCERVELWQLMHPAARRVKGLRRTLLGRFRQWLRNRRGEYPWFVQV